MKKYSDLIQAMIDQGSRPPGAAPSTPPLLAAAVTTLAAAALYRGMRSKEKALALAEELWWTQVKKFSPQGDGD